MTTGVACSCAVMLLCLLMSASPREADSAPRNSPACNTAAGGGCQTPGAAGRSERRPAAVRARRQTVVEVRKETSHRVACTRTEARRAACLNGECYALDIPGMRSAHCHCPPKYEGTRCEKLSVYYFLNYRADMHKFIIIVVVVLALIILIVVISIYCSYKKGKRKRSISKTKEDEEKVKEGEKTDDASEAMLANGRQPSPDRNGSLEVKAEVSESKV